MDIEKDFKNMVPQLHKAIMDIEKDFKGLIAGDKLDSDDLNRIYLDKSESDGKIISTNMKYDPNSNYISKNSIPNANLITNNSAWANGTLGVSAETYERPKAERYELKEVNGNMVVIDLSEQKVKNMTEKSRSVPSFSSKFPFIKFEKKRYTKITVINQMGNGKPVDLKIDCNLGMLMKLLKMEYSSWSKGIMNECVKHGSSQN